VEAGHTTVGRKSVWWATGGLETTSYPLGMVRTQSKKRPIGCIHFALGIEHTHLGHTPVLQEASTVGPVPERYVAKLGGTPDS
jgi:hypothetical protein